MLKTEEKKLFLFPAIETVLVATIFSSIGFFFKEEIKKFLYESLNLNSLEIIISETNKLSLLPLVNLIILGLTGILIFTISLLYYSYKKDIFEQKQINNHLLSLENKFDITIQNIHSEIEINSQLIEEIFLRKTTILDLDGAPKGKLMYFLIEDLPAQFINMADNSHAHSITEVLAVDHFQDLLLNATYVAYFFKRATDIQGVKRKLIVTRENELYFLKTYLNICWGSNYRTWLVNKKTYKDMISNALNNSHLDKAVKEILLGNPTIEYNEENEIIKVNYKNIEGELDIAPQDKIQKINDVIEQLLISDKVTEIKNIHSEDHIKSAITYNK